VTYIYRIRELGVIDRVILVTILLNDIGMIRASDSSLVLNLFSINGFIIILGL